MSTILLRTNKQTLMIIIFGSIHYYMIIVKYYINAIYFMHIKKNNYNIFRINYMARFDWSSFNQPLYIYNEYSHWFKK